MKTATSFKNQQSNEIWKYFTVYCKIQNKPFTSWSKPYAIYNTTAWWTPEGIVWQKISHESTNLGVWKQMSTEYQQSLQMIIKYKRYPNEQFSSISSQLHIKVQKTRSIHKVEKCRRRSWPLNTNTDDQRLRGWILLNAAFVRRMTLIPNFMPQVCYIRKNHSRILSIFEILRMVTWYGSRRE